MMKPSFATAFTALQIATAHTVFTTLFVNDVDQGDGACVRMPMTANNATFAVVGAPLSIDTACGVYFRKRFDEVELIQYRKWRYCIRQ